MSVSRDMGGKRTTGTLVSVLALLVASLAAVSCGSVPAGKGETGVRVADDAAMEADATTAAPRSAWEYLTEREWALIQMRGELVANGDSGEAPTLSLSGRETGRIAGFSGVNRYFGTYELGDGTVTLSITGMTRMAGPPEAMALEQAFVELANGGSCTYDVAEQTLNLYRDDRLVMMFGLRR